MKKMKVYSVVSMDGFVARTNGDIDWAIRYIEENSYSYSEFINQVDCVLINRNHYRQILSCDFQWQFKHLPCYILSKNSFVLQDNTDIHPLYYEKNIDIIDKATELSEQGYRNVWIAGDQDLIASFIDKDLIDEVTLLVIPVMLGHGIMLLGGIAHESQWRLTTVKSFDTGVVEISYSSVKKEV
ncbi:dihydrofolate reductase family protein [Bacteroidales bacterium OttesenSCG-928-I14]|nr:dihydrofolate reductase family protein [Bacteroidales bacterium OttesenSCG-928-I14]